MPGLDIIDADFDHEVFGPFFHVVVLQSEGVAVEFKVGSVTPPWRHIETKRGVELLGRLEILRGHVDFEIFDAQCHSKTPCALPAILPRMKKPAARAGTGNLSSGKIVFSSPIGSAGS